MKAAVVEAVGEPLRIRNDVDIAEPGPGQVLVEVASCGICHSDLTMAEVDGAVPTPVVLGHEAAGVVAQVGPGVRSLAAGDRVVLTPLPACGHCYYCARGESHLCADAMTFLSGLLPDGTSPLSRGGETVYRGLGVGAFAEYVITAESGAVKIADDIPLDVACVVGCAVQTGVGSVLNTARVEEGATVLVMGLGGIGVAIVQGARIAGATRIIASDPVAARRDAAADFGATDIFDPTVDDVVARCKELTGGIGVDYAFDGAGSAKLVEAGMDATRIGGTTVMVGAPHYTENVTIAPAALFTTFEKKLLGCLLGSCTSHRDIPRMLDFWRRGLLDLERMITARRPLDEVNAGLDDLRERRGIRTVLRVAG